MTVYWVTLTAVGYLIWLARATDPVLDHRPLGSLPTTTSARLLVGAAALVLVGVAASRWGVGTDFFGYVRNYDVYKTSFFTDLQSFDEPGIKGLAWLVSLVHDDPALFVAAASAATIGLMLWTITRYSIAVAMSYLLFVFVGSWHGSFNGVRQFLACAIILAGHRLIVDRKLLHFVPEEWRRRGEENRHDEEVDSTVGPRRMGIASRNAGGRVALPANDMFRRPTRSKWVGIRTA